MCMSIKICNVQSFSVHDGPGIRTTIFLAGCPLRCLWCHNPETHTPGAILVYDKEKCISCRQCEACFNAVHTFSPEHKVDRSTCGVCGSCVELCPSKALSLSSRVLEKEDFLRLVDRQKRLFGEDGGITFSGGEPLMQGEPLLDLLDGVDVHMALETCGCADEELFKKVIARMDYVMFDVKLIDEKEHIKYTGVSNRLILRNLEILRLSGKPYIVRTPLVSGVTDTPDNLSAIKEVVGDSPWGTLPYNQLASTKYERLGKTYKL